MSHAKAEFALGPCTVVTDDHVYFDVPPEAAFARSEPKPEPTPSVELHVWGYDKKADVIKPMVLNRQQRRSLKHKRPERFR